MSTIIDGVRYYSMSEVADRIGIHRNTIRIWAECSEELEAMGKPILIPKPYYGGKRNGRHWNDKDIQLIIEYRDTKKYGKLALVTRKNRGSTYTKTKPNMDRTKNIVFYHNVFDFEKFFSHYGYLSVKAVIDPFVKSCVVIADGKAFTVPFELLEREDIDGIKAYLKSKLER